MSKLPAISGKECVRILEKFGFVVYRQRGSHLTLIRKNPQGQTTVRSIRNSTGERFGRYFDRRESALMNLLKN